MIQPIQASQYSLNQGHPLILDSQKLEYPKDHQNKLLDFILADPSKYNHQFCKIPQEGYDSMKNAVLNTDNHGYTLSSGSIPAKKAISKFFSGENYQLKDEDIIIANGGFMAMFNVLNSMCEEGDNIIVPNIGYQYYQGFEKAYNVQIKYYELDENKNFEINLENLDSLIDDQTKFIYVVNPSNPLGSLWSKQHQLDILEVADKNKVVVVSDEIYWNMVYPGEEFISFGHLTTSVPVIVMTGLDKSFLVPGWTLAWLMFFDPKNYLNQVKNGFISFSQIMLHPPTFIMAGLQELFENISLNFIKDTFMPQFLQNKNRLVQEFNNWKGIKLIDPKGTLFVSLVLDLNQFNKIDSDQDFIQKLLTEQNVAALSLSTFQSKDVKVHGIRIFTCGNQELYTDFFQRLKQFCEKYYK